MPSNHWCDCDVAGGSLVNEGNIAVDVLDDGEITAVGCWGDYSSLGSINPTPFTPFTVPMDEYL